jgi:hypothetical protein
VTTKKAKIASDVAGPDGLWNQSATKLAEEVLHYQGEDSKPNWNQMLTAAAELGYPEINAGNLAQVIQELRDRVDAPEAPPVIEIEAEPIAVDDGALTEACIQLPEAPVVAFSDFISPNGLRWCVTVRAGLSPALARQAVAQTIDLAKSVETSALKAGWDAPGNGRKATAAPPPATASMPPVAGGNGNGDLTFQAQTLVANISEGNTYWKVKGGKWSQYGVTIWPEVLAAAGFEPDGLDPTQPYDLSGYTAQYIINDKGNPQKVTALVR